jgi:hypothetical protein
MTGQVKEEILTRWGELGVTAHQGALHFAPSLLRRDELLAEPAQFTYFDPAGELQTLWVPAGGLAFTICQTPVVYAAGDTPCITVTFAGGQVKNEAGSRLDEATSRHIWQRDGQVKLVQVTVVLPG